MSQPLNDWDKHDLLGNHLVSAYSLINGKMFKINGCGTADDFVKANDVGLIIARANRMISALAAENERLRKAGDDVALCLCADTDEQHKRRCAINWLAAKEGKSV